MKKTLLFLLLTLLLPFFLFLPLRQASLIPGIWASSPNTISYQGRLRESGQPVSGIRSIQFKLFDASSAGTEVFNSGAQAIYVSSGIFGYQLGGESFKNLSWATSSYWLEISVGGNAMSPREQINAMPYAFMASTAASLNGSGNVQITGSGPHYILNGNVGIGTTNPQAKLDLGGATPSNLQALFTRGASDNGFRLAAYNGSGTTINSEHSWFGMDYYGTQITGISFVRGGSVNGWMNFQSSTGNAGTTAMTIYSNGNVGIGTSAPAAKLEVNGITKMGSDSTGIISIKVLTGTFPSSTYAKTISFPSGWSSSDKIVILSYGYESTANDWWYFFDSNDGGIYAMVSSSPNGITLGFPASLWGKSYRVVIAKFE